MIDNDYLDKSIIIDFKGKQHMFRTWGIFGNINREIKLNRFWFLLRGSIIPGLFPNVQIITFL